MVVQKLDNARLVAGITRVLEKWVPALGTWGNRKVERGRGSSFFAALSDCGGIKATTDQMELCPAAHGARASRAEALEYSLPGPRYLPDIGGCRARSAFRSRLTPVLCLRAARKRMTAAIQDRTARDAKRAEQPPSRDEQRQAAKHRATRADERAYLRSLIARERGDAGCGRDFLRHVDRSKRSHAALNWGR